MRGPLSDENEASDEVDGEHEAVVIDSERLEPRSDEDDTYVQIMSLHLCFLWLLRDFSITTSPWKKKKVLFFSACKSTPLLHNEIEI